MSHTSDINQTFIIEPIFVTGDTPIISACTSLYTNAVIGCSGNTQIIMGDGIISFDGNLYTNNDLSATTINASTYFSGGTNLLDIFGTLNNTYVTGGTFNNITDTLTLIRNDDVSISVTGFTDYYTTGSTLIGSTVYFDRTDALSAYTLNLSGLITPDIYVTGVTFSNNQLIIVRNDGVSVNTFINTFTGLTVSGNLSATTYYGNGSNLTGIQDTYLTGGTYNNPTGTAIFTNNTGGTFSVSGFTTGTTNFDIYTTGATYSNGFVFFNRNDILSAYTLDVRVLTGDTNTFVTGGTLNIDTLELRRNDNVQVNIDLSTLRYSGGSAHCISEIYVTNVYGCSPITLHDSVRALNGVIVTGLTISDSLSATTLTAETITLTGIVNSLIYKFTYNDGFTPTQKSDLRIDGSTVFSNKLQVGMPSYWAFNRFPSYNNLGVKGGISLLPNVGDGEIKLSFHEINGGSGANNIIGESTINTLNGVWSYDKIFSATTISATTYYGDGSQLSNIADIYVTGMTLDLGNYDLTIIRNDGNSFSTNLGTLTSDVTITGGTYNSNTGVVTFTNNTGGTFSVSGFITGLTDTRISSFSYNNANQLSIVDSTGGTFTTLINVMTGLTVNSLSSTTISATTYLNLPNTTFTGWTYGTGFNAVAQTSDVQNTATNDYAFATGADTHATGQYSNASNVSSTALGYASHAEGRSTLAAGGNSHSEGYGTQANGGQSHAEGYQTFANGDMSHSGGEASQANGKWSFSHGYLNHADGDRSVVIGGSGIIGVSADTVYVPYFNIQSGTTDNSINTLLVKDSDGYIHYRTVGSITSGLTLQTITDNGATTTNVIKDGSNVNTLSFNSRALFDATGQQSILWNDRTLMDSSSSPSINWEGRYINRSTGALSVNWNNSNMYDTNAISSVQWDNRVLNNASGNTVMSWTMTGVTTPTISATTYLNLPTISGSDTFITGGTFNNNNLVLTNNTGGTVTTLINAFSGLTVNNGGGYEILFTGGASANIYNQTISQQLFINTNVGNINIGTSDGSSSLQITPTNVYSSLPFSASSYLGLPTDIRITGGTYNNPTGTAIFTNNTGGTFSVSGFITGSTGSSTLIGNGFNTYTAGTSTNPTVNISGGTFDNLTITGSGLSSTSVSATSYGTTATTGSILFSKNNLISQNNNRFKWSDDSYALLISSSGITSGATYQAQSPLFVQINDNNFYHYNIQNLSGGNMAASEYVLTADNGDLNNRFLATGINNSGFADPIYGVMTSNSGYLLMNGGNLFIGTQTAHDIVFHTSGTTTSKELMRMKPSGSIMIGGSSGTTDNGADLQVSGNTTISGGLTASTISATTINAQIILSGGTNINTLYMPTQAYSGLSKITVGTSAPISPSVGDLWIDTN